jgi:hypothetical protein
LARNIGVYGKAYCLDVIKCDSSFFQTKFNAVDGKAFKEGPTFGMFNAVKTLFFCCGKNLTITKQAGSRIMIDCV